MKEFGRAPRDKTSVAASVGPGNTPLYVPDLSINENNGLALGDSVSQHS